VLGAILGLALVTVRGFDIVVFGVVGFLLGFLYTAPPFRLAHRGLGELAVGLGFGPLIVVGSYFVQTGRWSMEAFYASLPVALLITAVLYINEFPDKYWDAKTGKRTWIVRLSSNAANNVYLFMALAAYTIIILGVITRIMPVATLLGLLTFPMARRAFNTLRRHHAYPYRLIPANATTIFIHLLTGLLLFAGYVIGGFIRI
jgi:1,4-dihydroxy-2-naphthoate octaprenyltransferase